MSLLRGHIYSNRPRHEKVSHVFCVRFKAIQIFDAQNYFNVSAASLISYAPYFICFGNGFVIIQKHV